jgi:REP element-mobilizing transposase RayT
LAFELTSLERIVETALERVRRSFGLSVYGYVVMPEHIHLLVNPVKRGLCERPED